MLMAKNPYAHKPYSTKHKNRKASEAAPLSNNKLEHKEITNDVATAYDIPTDQREIRATPRHAKAKIVKRGTRARYYGK